MPIKKLSFEEVKKFHKFRGEFGACINAIFSGECDGCCKSGSVLFPGEDDYLLDKQAKGLISEKIIIGRPNDDEDFKVVKKCFENGCGMKDYKPIACRITPLVKVSPFVGQITNKKAYGCPAIFDIPKKFLKAATEIREKLKIFMTPSKEILRNVEIKTKRYQWRKDQGKRSM